MITQKLETAHDAVDRFAMRLYDLILYVLARMILVEVTWEEVTKGSRPWKPPARIPEKVNLDQALFRFNQQEEASKHTDDKVKQLLTLSVALNAFLVAFTQALGLGFYVLVTAFALTASVFLCVGTLRVRSTSQPDLSDAIDDPEQYAWAKDLVDATQQQLLSHQYRTDLYRAARRWFLLAFALAPVIVAVAPRQSASKRSDINVINIAADTAVTTLTNSTDTVQLDSVETNRGVAENEGVTSETDTLRTSTSEPRDRTIPPDQGNRPSVSSAPDSVRPGSAPKQPAPQ